MRRISGRLARTGISPNVISLSSMVFAAVAGVALIYTAKAQGAGSTVCFVVAAVMIQARLLANLFDGMVAHESGKISPLGALFNEVPDRVSDAVLLIAAGYGAHSDVILGYLAATAALFVAYVRAIGASVGVGQAFHGPMGKSQRMFVLTVAALVAALAPDTFLRAFQVRGVGVVGIVLAVIIVGGVITSVRRLIYICRRVAAPEQSESD